MNTYQIEQSFELRPGEVHLAPLTWFIDRASLAHHDLVETTEVFTDLVKVFDPRIIKPTDNQARILRRRDMKDQYQYFSADIFMLKTKTHVGQFLVVFNPLLKVCNMLFTELLIKKHNSKTVEDEYNLIKSNDTEPMYEINPYDHAANLADLKYKEDDNLEYKAS
jgi:hypothetical protein